MHRSMSGAATSGGAAALPRVGVERELRDDEDGTARLAGRAVHLPLTVACTLEDANHRHLAREPLQLGPGVVRGDAEVHEETTLDRTDQGAVHGDGGTQDTLEDGAHEGRLIRLRYSSLTFAGGSGRSTFSLRFAAVSEAPGFVESSMPALNDFVSGSESPEACCDAIRWSPRLEVL